MSESYLVQPTGGLCNYLRVVFSHWLYCKKEGIPLTVIWEVTSECNGFFLDYFEPLEGVTFLKENSGLPVTYSGNRWQQEYNPYQRFIYEGLKPLPWLQEKINAKKVMLGNYVSVHIRRTDHVWLAKAEYHYTSDDEFIEFIKMYPNENLYIATDNRLTQDQFHALFHDKMLATDFIESSDSLRQTNIEQAILDIFVCANSLHFKGSGFSSFSATIYQMREPTKSDHLFERILGY